MRFNTKIGPTEKQVLIELARKRDQLISWIFEGISERKGRQDYSAIFIAVKRLIKKGYVHKGSKVRTKKGNLEYTYHLSDRGLAYVLVLSDVKTKEKRRALENYSSTKYGRFVRYVHNYFGDEDMNRLYKAGAALLQQSEVNTVDVWPLVAGAAFGLTLKRAPEGMTQKWLQIIEEPELRNRLAPLLRIMRKGLLEPKKKE